jgi:hypothetical protein
MTRPEDKQDENHEEEMHLRREKNLFLPYTRHLDTIPTYDRYLIRYDSYDTTLIWGACAENTMDVVWLKKDVRLHDHAPLSLIAARNNSRPCIILYREYTTSSRRHRSFSITLLFTYSLPHSKQ